MDSPHEVAGWGLEGNVRTLMTWLAHYVGYAYDESDWQALELALSATDADASGGWYDYPLSGSPALTVWLAQNLGATVVSVRVTGAMDALLAARAGTLLDVLADVHPAQ